MGGTHVRIRPAGPGDLEVLRECAKQAYSPYIPLIGREPAPMLADFAEHIAREEAFIGTDDQNIPKGYVICFATRSALQLENVAVFPEYAGQGIGSALIRFCEARARDAGLPAVTLYTNAKMHRNLALYPRLGYAEVDRRQEDGFDRVYFEKTV